MIICFTIRSKNTVLWSDLVSLVVFVSHGQNNSSSCGIASAAAPRFYPIGIIVSRGVVSHTRQALYWSVVSWATVGSSLARRACPGFDCWRTAPGRCLLSLRSRPPPASPRTWCGIAHWGWVGQSTSSHLPSSSSRTRPSRRSLRTVQTWMCWNLLSLRQRPLHTGPFSSWNSWYQFCFLALYFSTYTLESWLS